MATFDVTEPQRRQLWRWALREGDLSLARTLAAECPTKNGLTDLPCPCHGETRERNGTHIATGAYCEGVVGHRTRIAPNACVGPMVTIGDDCMIGPGAVIGWEGFGYSRDGLTDALAIELGEGRWQMKEQRYGVRIGDGVHVGANACIDRGSWRDTVIGPGSKIDNLVHVAHNVIIGEDVLIIAQAMLGGSAEVGDGAWIAPHAVVREHVKIGRRAFVALGAVVVKNVDDGESVRGIPAKAFQRVEAGKPPAADGHHVAP